MTDISLFTGISGQNNEEALEHLQSESNQDIGIIKFEDKLQEITNVEHIETLGSSGAQFREIKNRFRETINRLSSSGGELENLGEASEHIYLGMHVTYLSEQDESIFSPVDFAAINNQLSQKVQRIIVLIDDVYDVYLRLMQPGEKYHQVDAEGKNPYQALKESIDNLNLLLRWRDKEITTSLDIAHMLDVPIYIVSVKHPAFMISRLTDRSQNELDIYYLSHHITIPRVKWDEGEYQDFQQELGDFTRNVYNRDSTVVFLPDTIDEYRLLEDTDNILKPKLKDRWNLNLPSGEFLVPPERRDINPLNPLDYEYTQEELKDISGRLKMLRSEIGRQIEVRDYLLVQQSKSGILGFRPLLEGELSTGLSSEMDYSYRRMTSGEESRRNIVVIKRSDKGKRKIYNLFESLKAINVPSEIIESPENVLESIRDEWFTDSEKVGLFFSGNYDENEIRDEIESELGVSNEYQFQPPDQSGTSHVNWQSGDMYEAHQNRRDGWERAFEVVEASEDFQFDEEIIYRNRINEIMDELLDIM